MVRGMMEKPTLGTEPSPPNIDTRVLCLLRCPLPTAQVPSAIFSTFCAYLAPPHVGCIWAAWFVASTYGAKVPKASALRQDSRTRSILIMHTFHDPRALISPKYFRLIGRHLLR